MRFNLPMEQFDLVVIGGGAGGIAAADAGLRRGVSVLVVQDGPMGGDCTFTGCVPSKTLIAAAARRSSGPEALGAVRAAVARVAAHEDADTFRARGATVVEGRARFVSRDRIVVGGQRFRGRRIVVATGATPVVPPIDGLTAARPLTSDTLWDLDALPASVAVLGGGPIGVELAQALARLGVTVTLLEAEARVLGREEPAAARVVADALVADGVDVRTGARVDAVRRLDDGRVMVTAAGADVETSEVLVAIGRRPVTDGLDLAAAGVCVDDRGHVRVDDGQRTTAPHVYAVGDVTGTFPFTHGAYEMGRVAVATAFGNVPWQRFDPDVVPFATYTDPEIGRVGLTEAEAHERWGDGARVVEVSMDHVDRAVTEGRTEGFVVLVAAPGGLARSRASRSRTVRSRIVRAAVDRFPAALHPLGGRLVGATVVAPHAGELVAEVALAMRLRIPPAALALTTHAYPTWGMAVQQAASGFFVESPGVTVRPAQAG